MQQDHCCAGAEAESSHQWARRRSAQLQVSPQELRAPDSRDADARPGLRCRWGYSSLTTRDHRGWSMSFRPEVTVAQSEVHEDRFSRLRLIPWWDEHRIQNTRVLVVGAGALGNEVLKNLALLGFQKIAIVDLDRIEESNLSRAVLYRTSDVGR